MSTLEIVWVTVYACGLVATGIPMWLFRKEQELGPFGWPTASGRSMFFFALFWLWLAGHWIFYAIMYLGKVVL